MILMIKKDDLTDQTKNKSFTIPFRRAMIFGIVFLSLYIILYFLLKNNPDLCNLVMYAMITLLYSAVTLALYLAAKSINPSEKRVKIGWTMLMLAVFTSIIGNILWAISIYYNQNPTTSIAAVFYLLFNPLFLAGILLFPSSYNNPFQRFKRYFDIFIIMFSISIIFGIFIIAPGLKNFNGDFKSLVMALT